MREATDRKATNDSKHSKHGFLTNGGEMGKLIRAHDWKKTTLGALEDWPQSLRTAVSIMLETPLPIVILWGKDGVMLYNDNYSAFAGGRHPLLLGSKVVEGWPEVADFNRNVLKHCLAGETLSYEGQQLTLYRNNVPEDVWMNLSYSPIMNEAGQPEGVLAIVIETTRQVLAIQKQKAAEAALSAERERLHSLFMQAPAIIAVLRGPDHVYELANPLYTQIIGNRSIIGKPIREALPELAGQGIYEILDEVYKTGKPYFAHELPLDIDKTASGVTEQIYLNFVYQPAYDESGNVDSILIHAVDVTEQVAARQTIEEIATFNRIITDNATTALLIIDENHRCTFMNPAAEKMTGITFEAMKAAGKSLHDMVHHKKPDGSPFPESECPDSTLLSSQSTAPIEATFVRPDGSMYPVNYMASPIVSNGSTIGIVIEARDITEEKRALKEQQRLISITNQRNELIKLNTAKDEFISLASHQLRTPATAVKQYISLLLGGYGGTVTPDQVKFLQTAYDSNERQLNIIHDLLKTAQIDSSRYALHKERQVIGNLVQEAIDELTSALELKHQKIILEDSDTTTKVLVDRNEIKLVFVNLLENASKYSHDGKKIEISMHKSDKHLEICFHDHGVGLSPEDSHHIFEKFTRINNELSDTVTGTGLGLYWVKRIIKLHLGSIKVESTLGVGTTFTVRLPL